MTSMWKRMPSYPGHVLTTFNMVWRATAITGFLTITISALWHTATCHRNRMQLGHWWCRGTKDQRIYQVLKRRLFHKMHQSIKIIQTGMRTARLLLEWKVSEAIQLTGVQHAFSKKSGNWWTTSTEITWEASSVVSTSWILLVQASANQ